MNKTKDQKQTANFSTLPKPTTPAPSLRSALEKIQDVFEISSGSGVCDPLT
jgi:hypothetical protein